MDQQQTITTDHDLLIRLDTKVDFISELSSKTNRDLQVKADVKDVQELHRAVENFRANIAKEIQEKIAIAITPLQDEVKNQGGRLTVVETATNDYYRSKWTFFGAQRGAMFIVIGIWTVAVLIINHYWK